MSRIAEWKGSTRLAAPAAAERAASVWAWIQRKPTSIVLIRGGVVQAAQTVRLELSSPSELQRESGVGAKRTINLFGIQGHATLASTDVQRGDTFKANGSTALNCEIISVDFTQIGQVQAIAEIME